MDEEDCIIQNRVKMPLDLRFSRGVVTAVWIGLRRDWSSGLGLSKATLTVQGWFDESPEMFHKVQDT